MQALRGASPLHPANAGRRQSGAASSTVQAQSYTRTSAGLLVATAACSSSRGDANCRGLVPASSSLRPHSRSGALGARLQPCHASSGSGDDASAPLNSTAAAAEASPLLAPSGPWTPAELESLAQHLDESEAEALGRAWMAEFESDPEQLYSYVDEAWREGPTPVISPLTRLANMAGEEHAIKLPGPVANEVVGMGTWRLKGNVDPVIEFLVTRLEGQWRDMLDDDLCLYPADKWKEQGFDWCDSMDPQRELGGWAYADVPLPVKGDEEYPRLFLENRIYSSRVFRKLHLEVGLRQDGLEVLHMVLYPRYTYDLPILAADLVVANGRVTLAIVDACPVSANQRLSPHYMQTMAMLQETFLPDVTKARSIPEWGSRIFSPLCVCIAPQTPEELSGFVKYMLALHRAHLQLACIVGPVVGMDRRSEAKRKELLEAHKRFVDNQLANLKTRRVLEVAFGNEWADKYMTQIMFDYNPDYNPPYFDSSIERLYDYFEHNPEYGILTTEHMRLEAEAQGEKSRQYLTALAQGQDVSPQKLEEALQYMYDSDPQFAAAVSSLLPHMDELHAEGHIGKTLAAQLSALAAPAAEPVPAAAAAAAAAVASPPAPPASPPAGDAKKK